MLSRIANKLHDEHEATLGLAARVSRLIQVSGDTPPDPTEARVERTLDELAQAISGEVRRHFFLEEEALFPILRADGHGAIADLLTLEHQEILPIGDEVGALVAEMRKKAISDSEWRQFCQLGQDFFHRLMAHIEKEEAGLIPLVDECLDREAEARILSQYS